MPVRSILTVSTTRQQIGYHLRNMAALGTPLIDIALHDSDGHSVNASYVRSYSTMDRIEGVVGISVSHDTRFDEIEIALTGVSKTFVDRMSSTTPSGNRHVVAHQFLKLVQPIDEESLPLPRVLAAGHTYEFPFTFVVPEQLLPRACQHRCDSDVLARAHLQLPPSMGDPETAGFGGVLRDDMAPAMAKVIYSVCVRVTLDDRSGNEVILAHKAQKVRIKPVFEESPPLTIDEPQDADYCLRREKTLRRGLLKGRLGTLVVESTQPKSFRIPGARRPPNEGISTVARVLLRFDPASATSQPPKLGNLVSKLRVATFHSITPRRSFPSRAALAMDMALGLYSETADLSSRSMASAQWTFHDGKTVPPPPPSLPPSRRDSGVSDCSAELSGIPTPSKDYAGSGFYTTELLVPITLPLNKNFLPTFHACFLSRIYVLQLQLSVSGAGVLPTLTLKVPIQITAEGSESGTANLLAREEAVSLAQEADAAFSPRSIAPTAQHADDAPPGYEVLGRTHVGYGLPVGMLA